MQGEWKLLLEKINRVLTEEAHQSISEEKIVACIQDAPPAHIALSLEELSAADALRVFKTLSHTTAAEVLAKLDQDTTYEIVQKLSAAELAKLIKPMAPREAAAVLVEAKNKDIKKVLSEENADLSAVRDTTIRMNYPKGSAGRLMTSQFVKLHSGITVKDAIEVVTHTKKEVDIPNDLYVIQRDTSSLPARNKLLGVVSIRELLMCSPDCSIEEVMTSDIVSVRAEEDEEDAAALLSKYKFRTLPVTDKEGYLLGVIPADDLMPVVYGRLRSLYNKAVGTDAEKMEKLSPVGEAKIRIPWLLGTMGIELCAGLVIAHYDAILKEVILLASFMPVISAISGNVGLQSAAITVRAIDTGQRKGMWKSVKKEGATSMIMAIVCGSVLGAIGAIWSKEIPFGFVICAALICSMLTAGLMGTVIPILSKKLGFDPATTAGPFETAFQDVVGFFVFLWLATQMLHWLQ